MPRFCPSRRVLGLLWIGLLLLGSGAQAFGQLRIAAYNTNNYGLGDTLPRPAMAEVLAALGDQAKAGFARPVDILVLEEQSALATSTDGYVDLLNELYGAGTYARGELQGSTTGGGRPAVVYNTRTVSLISESEASQASSAGGPRATLRYEFRPVGYDAAADFYVYASHLKAVDDAASAERRGIEAAEIRANADALGEGTLAIYAGDMNFYRASEIGFQTLIAPGPGQAFDPVDRVGSWTNSNTYRDVHTQSPVTTASFPGQVTGGLDDRFDFQLVTGEVLDGRGFDIIPGSYWALGNTGTHSLNGPLSSGSMSALQARLPGYSLAQATAVVDALMTASDHLPVVADYQLPAKLAVAAPTLPPAVLRGAAIDEVFAVSNAAPVAVVTGADLLSYAITSSGAVEASGSGTRSPLSSAASHAIHFDTSVAGLQTGTLSVTSSSPQAAGANFAQNYSVDVIDRAVLSATGTPGGGGGDGGGGGGGGGGGDQEPIPFIGTYTFGSDGNVTSFAYNGDPLTGVSAGDLLKVGITSSSSSGNFRGTAWPIGGTNGSDVFAGVVDLDHFIEFTLTADEGGRVSMEEIEFGLGRSGTGPRQWEWRSSGDGFSTPITTYETLNPGLGLTGGVLTNPDGNASWTGNRLDLTDAAFQDQAAVTLRLYGYNAEGTGGTGGLQGPLTFNGLFLPGGSTEASAGDIAVGESIVVSNAAAEAGTQRASAAIVSRAISGAAGWSVNGLAIGETVVAGATSAGTAVFDAAGRLNGTYPATFTLGFEHADQSLPGTAAGDLGTLTWDLVTTVTGQTGSGTTIVDAGMSLAGYGLGSAGPFATRSLLEAGTAEATGPVTMRFDPPPTAGLFASDVLTLTGTSPGAVVLSLTYDAAAAAGFSGRDVCLGWLDARQESPTFGTWINAIDGNAVNQVTQSDPFAGSWTSYSSDLGGVTPATAIGAWGIDSTSGSVWAVIDHASQFAVIPLGMSPRPGDANLDGKVDVFDLVQVNTAGKYGTGAAATWAEGDFNGDGVTSVFDLVAVNVGGAYGQGAMQAAAASPTAVPEPGLSGLLAVAGLAVYGGRRLVQHRRAGQHF
jgi:endonuclease/exonuclease/phosphatase family metal-dependent hydrolase